MKGIYLVSLEVLGLTVAFAVAVVFFILRPKLAEAKLKLQEASESKEKTEVEARERASQVIAEAKEEAARLRKDAELDTAQRLEGLKRQEVLIQEARDELIKSREGVEQEANKRLAAFTRQEEKLSAKEESIEARRNSLEAREEALRAQERSINERIEEVVRREQSIDAELHRVAGLTPEAAKQMLLEQIEDEFRDIALRRARQIEVEVAAETEKKAKKLLLDVMERSVVDYVTAATLAVVELPSEDMKGRIIGREGRNIRAFEQVTGVDLIVDETPEAVVISCFDPVRRETARLALMNLMVDGRIHPGRIEELYEKAQQEVDRMIKEAGERAVERANVVGISPKVIDYLGRLRFRTSYAQNVLDHSVEVSRLCASLAAEMGLNVELAKRAGLLHDIGKALGPEWEGPHAITGMEFLRAAGEKEGVLHAVGAHHHEIEPSTPEAILVILADTISAARPGARRENLENYLKRLTALETLANSFPGVDRSYAVQAGREIRLIVKPDLVDDLGALRLADEVARRIEGELEYPGQIKVTVIRETRSSDIAK